MIHFKRSLIIDANTNAVWSVLGRYMHIHEFAPLITAVTPLTDGENRVGSKRRNHFENGTSVVEEITVWKPGEGFTVKLSDMESMPLHQASSQVHIAALGSRSRVTWTFDYKVKYGPLGWLMGQTLMKAMMGRVLASNLKALADKVKSVEIPYAQYAYY